MAIGDNHQPVGAGQVDFLLHLKEEPPARADEGPCMSKRMRDAESVTKMPDRGAEFFHGHTMLPSVLAQQSRLDELTPRDDPGAGRLWPNDRQVLPTLPRASL